MAESLGILGYDSFHFIVADLARSRRFYTEALGLHRGRPRLRRQGRRRGARRPRVFGAGQIRVLVSTPVRKDSRAARYLRIHPDGISSLAFRVQDIEQAWAFLEKRGGDVPLRHPDRRGRRRAASGPSASRRRSTT